MSSVNVHSTTVISRFAKINNRIEDRKKLADLMEYILGHRSSLPAISFQINGGLIRKLRKSVSDTCSKCISTRNMKNIVDSAYTYVRTFVIGLKADVDIANSSPSTDLSDLSPNV